MTDLQRTKEYVHKLIAQWAALGKRLSEEYDKKVLERADENR